MNATEHDPSWLTEHARPLALVVDDDVLCRRLTVDILKSHFKVVEATSAAHALILADELRPDLVIVDLIMPDLNGIQVAERLTKMNFGTKIIMVTGSSDERDHQAALESGVIEVICKPFHPQQLLNRSWLATNDSALESAVPEAKRKRGIYLAATTNENIDSGPDAWGEILRQISAGILHELNNPLNYAKASLFYMNTLVQKAPKECREDMSETLADTADGVRRVSDIVTNLRCFAYCKANLSETLDLASIIVSACEKAKPKGTDYGRDTTITLSLVPGVSILADQDLLISAFQEIVANAYFFAEAAKLRQEQPHIWVTMAPGASSCVTNIKDNGTGIPAEELQKVLMPFYTSRPVGTALGLGLTRATTIIRAHNGTFRCLTKEAPYAEFSVELPITRLEAESRPVRASAELPVGLCPSVR